MGCVWSTYTGIFPMLSISFFPCCRSVSSHVVDQFLPMLSISFFPCCRSVSSHVVDQPLHKLSINLFTSCRSDSSQVVDQILLMLSISLFTSCRSDSSHVVDQLLHKLSTSFFTICRSDSWHVVDQFLYMYKLSINRPLSIGQSPSFFALAGYRSLSSGFLQLDFFSRSVFNFEAFAIIRLTFGQHPWLWRTFWEKKVVSIFFFKSLSFLALAALKSHWKVFQKWWRKSPFFYWRINRMH
jgi:hypothetical protein